MNKILLFRTLCAIILPFAIISCSEEDYGDASMTRISKSDLNPAFTVAKVTANKFLLTSDNKNVINSKWDMGDGAGYVKLSSDTIFLPDAGTYSIKHVVTGAGGVISDTITKVVTVEKSDPVAGNLVKGGKFASAADFAQWTVNPISGANANWVLDNGWAHVTNAAYSWGQAGLQQAIQVEANKKYKIDLSFRTNGVNQGWFKVYAALTQPVQGVEYTGNILVCEIPIWTNNSTPFSGKMSSILNPDSGLKTGGVVTFSTSGTIYLSIQCGAQDLQSGVYITNVEFRGVAK